MTTRNHRQTETLSRVDGTSTDNRTSSSELCDGVGIADSTQIQYIKTTSYNQQHQNNEGYYYIGKY